MSLARHSTPGFVSDGLTEENQQRWSDRISSFMSYHRPSRDPHVQFYDATRVQEPDSVVGNAPIGWNAFPRNISINNPGNRWKAADQRRIDHDEYCEWSVERNSEDRITRVTFTTEGPEYFAHLFENQPEVLVRLCQQMNPGAEIAEADFAKVNEEGKTVYDPENKWNAPREPTTGPIMHLAQGNNTISALILLAAEATDIRQSGGSIVEDRDLLIRCSRFGDPNRHSDPHVGAIINGLARDGSMITLDDPVGLYIDPVDGIRWDAITTPDNSDPHTWCQFSRGTERKLMRAEFRSPTENHILGDLRVDGRRLEHGSQLADLITIQAFGRAFPRPEGPANPKPCVSGQSQAFAQQRESGEGAHSCRYVD